MAIRNLSGKKRESARARILLVDDNVSGLCARRSVLEELGYLITTASNGTEAMAEFTARPCEMVVTDYKMPVMDGLELIRQLRAIAPRVGIVLISGYTDALGMDEKSTGADAVIQKSSNEVSHLVRAVSRLLKKRPTAKAATKISPAKLATAKIIAPKPIAKKPAAKAHSTLVKTKTQGS